MEKLELKHLAPYLPYNLEIKQPEAEGRNTFTLDVEGLRIMEVQGYGYFKPILRPLSDLSKFYDDICWGLYDSRNPSNYRFAKFTVDLVINQGVEFSTDFGFVEWLFENHFDVFGLIEKSSAIDINTLSGEAS